MRILQIKLDFNGGVSEYKITSDKGCCFENLIKGEAKKELSKLTYGYYHKSQLTEKDKRIGELREGLGMVLEEYVIGASQMNEFKYKYSHLLEDKE